MASTVGPSPPSDRRLSIESLPIVDLRLLSQSELTALSLCSSHSYDLRLCDDVVIPKIDRTIFNESAGSRKQTFSRLRLAPRNLSTPPPPPPPMPKPRPPLDSDNSRIISLFKSLFNNNGGDFVDDTEGNLVPVNVEYSEVLLSGGGGERKRKRGGIVSDGVDVVVSVARDDENEKETEYEKEKELVNKNGEVVDLKELGKKEDPFGEEIKKRTEGKESAEELLGFVSGLDGVWGSTRKKRKIVDANLFGDYLPNGWKLLIAIKKKQGRAWLFCRRYISPNGRYFVSCKEVSSYLLSLTGPEDEQPAVECLEDEVADNELASENATDLGNKIDNPSLSITAQSNDLEILQRPLSTSETIDHEKKVGMLTNVLPGGQASSSLKCHKCSTTFGEKDELLNHLLSCHKRKRRKSGAPVEDDIMMKDGKYECQFCNKVFNERSSYFGHVGIHVKNYVKSIGGSPGLTLASKQKDSSCTVACGEVNFYSADSKPEAGCEAEKQIENGVVFQNNIQLSLEAAQNIKLSADVSSAELDGTTHTTENNVRDVEQGVDFSAMKPAACSVSQEENDNDNIDLCEKFGGINATDCIDSEIIKAPTEPVQLDEADFVSDSNPADLGNDGNFALQREREASEIDLLFENKETSSYDQNSEDRSLVNNTIDQSCFTEVLEFGDDDDRLMNGSDSGHLDLGVDVRDGVQCPGSLDGTSNVLHKEEGACVITAKRIDFMESPPTESNENGSFCLSGDQPKTEMQNFDRKILFGRGSGTDVDTCCLEDTETIVDAQKRPEACGSLQSKGDAYGYISNEDETEGFHVEQICSVVNSPRELSSRKSEDLKSDQVLKSGNSFFTPESNDRHLTAEVIASNDQAHSDVSNLLGAFNNFVEDKQEEVPKNIFSGLSLNQHLHEVSINNMTDAPSTTSPMSLPELDKVDTSRTNKLIYDFSSVTDMNSRLLGSVQNESIPQGTSPFSLWGQQTCTMEDDQNRVYGSVRGLVQQERASGNNLLNLVGLQQPSNVGLNLNKVHRNERRYGVQNNETMTEGMSHGNTLNLAGFQQQCDTGYNLNKSCINQQSYDMQCNETGAYSTSNESKQARVTTYGNSLSLASVPQTCEPRYCMNKACMPQTCDTGFGLNKGYMGTMQELSKLNELGHSRDQDLMIGFGNSGGRPNQNVANDILWRGAEGSILPGGLMDSSSRGQPSGSYQAFDFLSDKGGNDLYAANDKFDNISSFEGLRPTSVEPMEFSFMTPQDSNLHLGHKNALPYNNNAQINQGFGTSVWHQKPSLPNMNMMAGHVVNTVCVWCGNEFHQDSLTCEMQAGSIGYLCPTCKARMSGQFL